MRVVPGPGRGPHAQLDGYRMSPPCEKGSSSRTLNGPCRPIGHLPALAALRTSLTADSGRPLTPIQIDDPGRATRWGSTLVTGRLNRGGGSPPGRCRGPGPTRCDRSGWLRTQQPGPAPSRRNPSHGHPRRVAPYPPVCQREWPDGSALGRVHRSPLSSRLGTPRSTGPGCHRSDSDHWIRGRCCNGGLLAHWKRWSGQSLWNHAEVGRVARR
jgi:hypothetical protein